MITQIYDHFHGEIACDVPKSECKIWDAVETICNDWDRETIKRERQRNQGWKSMMRALNNYNLSAETIRELATAYYGSHERPVIRHGKLK